MKDILSALQSTPLPVLLAFVGAVFLFLAVAGGTAEKLGDVVITKPLSLRRQILAGSFGSAFLIISILMTYAALNSTPAATPTAASALIPSPITMPAASLAPTTVKLLASKTPPIPSTTATDTMTPTVIPTVFTATSTATPTLDIDSIVRETTAVSAKATLTAVKKCAPDFTPRLKIHEYGESMDPESQGGIVIVSDIYAGRKLGEIPFMLRFQVIDGPVCAFGTVWWKIFYDYKGIVGWIQEGYVTSDESGHIVSAYFVVPANITATP